MGSGRLLGTSIRLSALQDWPLLFLVQKSSDSSAGKIGFWDFAEPAASKSA